jgi:D-glycero-D-manno-heptose 1,7-bisphosphate phosphatase
MLDGPLLILDRDGVINVDSDDYIRSPDEWLAIPGSLDAIARLGRAGYTIAVASNQSGLARGYFDRATLDAIHDKMLGEVEAAGGHLELIRVCPHGPDDGCDCRKPEPGLLLQIADALEHDLQHVPVIGDSLRDLLAAVAVGASPILVRTGMGEQTAGALPPGLEDTPVFDDLAAAADALIECRS